LVGWFVGNQPTNQPTITLTETLAGLIENRPVLFVADQLCFEQAKLFGSTGS
jgi:hypothetical protein